MVPTLVAIKKDVTEYAIQIASHGFAVVNINYELAPSATYPGPIIQLTEAYQYITEIAADYPFDLDQIFFCWRFCRRTNCQPICQYSSRFPVCKTS